MYDEGWQSTRSDGWWKFDDVSGEHVVLFQRDGEWSVAHGGWFSKEKYDDPEDAAKAFDNNSITWVSPAPARPVAWCGWQQSKVGGWYRRDRWRGTVSVKKAKSGKWYWSSMSEGGPHGWFASAEEAKRAADYPQTKAMTVSTPTQAPAMRSPMATIDMDELEAAMRAGVAEADAALLAGHGELDPQPEQDYGSEDCVGDVIDPTLLDWIEA